MLRKATSLLSHWAVTRWHPTQVCKVCGGRPLLGIRSFVILVLNMSGVMLALKHCIIPRIIDRHQFEVSSWFHFDQLSKCVIVHICSICFKVSHTWLDVLSYFQILYIYIYTHIWCLWQSKQMQMLLMIMDVSCSGLPWRKGLILTNTMALPRRCLGPWQEIIPSVDALVHVLTDGVCISYTYCHLLLINFQGVSKRAVQAQCDKIYCFRPETSWD